MPPALLMLCDGRRLQPCRGKYFVETPARLLCRGGAQHKTIEARRNDTRGRRHVTGFVVRETETCLLLRNGFEKRSLAQYTMC